MQDGVLRGSQLLGPGVCVSSPSMIPCRDAIAMPTVLVAFVGFPFLLVAQFRLQLRNLRAVLFFQLLLLMLLSNLGAE